jgi:hypothetical protein
VSAARVDYPWCDTRHYCTRYLRLRGNDLYVDYNAGAAAPGFPTMMTETTCLEFFGFTKALGVWRLDDKTSRKVSTCVA